MRLYQQYLLHIEMNIVIILLIRMLFKIILKFEITSLSYSLLLVTGENYLLDFPLLHCHSPIALNPRAKVLFFFIRRQRVSIWVSAWFFLFLFFVLFCFFFHFVWPIKSSTSFFCFFSLRGP